jgi:hypothetical protein
LHQCRLLHQWESTVKLYISVCWSSTKTKSSCHLKVICSNHNEQYKRKRTKGQMMIYKTLHRKLKIEQHKPYKNRGWTRVLRKGNQFLLHIWDHHATLVTDRVISHEWGEDRIVITKNSAKTVWLYIQIMCPNGATCLTAV